MRQQPRALFLSAVDGGPISRIVKAIKKGGQFDIEVVSALSTTRWMHHRNAGRINSLAARLLVLLFYPFVAAFRARNADVLIATTNPFWLPNLLLWTRRYHRAQIITLVYDVYPDSLTSRSSALAVIGRAMHALNRAWTQKSDAVVYISRGMQTALVRRYGQPRRSDVIYTGADPSEFQHGERQPDLEAWLGNRILISYVGNVGHVHEVDTIVSVLTELARTHGDQVAVLISATGARAADLVQGLANLPHVWTEPVLTNARWVWVLHRTDIAVASLSAAATTASMPSKFFSALAAGCAMFVVAPQDSDISRLTIELGVGACVEPGDVRRGVETLRGYLENRSTLQDIAGRATQAAHNRFDVSALAIHWQGLLHAVLNDDAVVS